MKKIQMYGRAGEKMSADKQYPEEVIRYIQDTYTNGQTGSSQSKMEPGHAAVHDSSEEPLARRTSARNSRPKYADLLVFTDEQSGKMFATIGKAKASELRKAAYTLKMDDIPFINLKADPDFAALMTGQDGILPVLRMSKKNWITVLLDGSVPMEKLKGYIDRSYHLVTDSAARRIYEAVKRIPKGKVATYAQVAAMAGNPRMYRAVGNALHHNPDEQNIPCYRVVNSQGRLSGAFAFGGPEEQANRLRADGIEVVDGKVDLRKYQMSVPNGLYQSITCFPPQAL